MKKGFFTLTIILSGDLLQERSFMKGWAVRRAVHGILALLVFGWLHTVQAAGYPVIVTDASGATLTFSREPARVVSLVPSATEMLMALGCGNSVAGLTYHDAVLPGAQGKTIVGGFFSPSLKAIEAARPDLLIVSPHHQSLIPRFSQAGVPVLVFETLGLAEAEDHLRRLGRVFNREAEAQTLTGHQRKQMELIREKVATIPREKRKRVTRFMGRNEIMAPGDNSFQNAMIRAAGGVPPVWDKPGAIVPITLEEWQRFNPQILYGCGEDRELAQAFFSRPGWREVEAIKNGQVHYFPCDLTCRAATHTGDFVSWLASVIYTEEFVDPRHQVRSDGITHSRRLPLVLPYIQEARIAGSTIQDFSHKTLLIEFTTPQKIVSTLEGQRDGVLVVGNHYSPPPAWSLDHHLGLEGVQRRVYNTLGLPRERASLLFTGADMDHLAIRQAEFKELKVTALVTAGVETNAVRMSRDRGDYYEPGTINIILLTNRSLSPRAMTRAIIDATEAKTAALWDMDIRSSFTSRVNPATGTGTDNIIVVQGTGAPLDNAGGHTKLGELVASAVYAGVQEAIQKQNGLVPGRKIFQRLRERRLELYTLSSQARLACGTPDRDYTALLEEALLEPAIAGFLESALAISDAYERGLIQDLEPFRQWCRLTASEIAGQPVRVLMDPLGDADLPPVIRLALNAIFSGLQTRPVSAAAGPKAP